MSILIFILVLFILVLVHELGHFAVAKWFGIKVEEFGIGFPPKLFGKRYGETEYTLNALPIGGFVKIYGEDPTQEHIDGPDSGRSFVHKPRLVQAAVLVAGVFMNVVLAWLLFTGGVLLGMPTAVDESERDKVENPRVLITGVLPGSPADGALKASDEIRAVRSGDRALTGDALSPSAVVALMGENAGRDVVFTVVRREEAVDVTVRPAQGVIPDEPDKVAAGFVLSIAGTMRLPFFEAVVEGSKQTFGMLREVAVGLYTFLAQAVTGRAELSQVSGPVGIAGLVGDAASLGFAWLVTFTAFISLNLAVLNLLPFPALDGGRLLFVIIESVTRRPIPPRFANRANQIGFLLLLALMVIVTAHDVVKLL